MTIDIDSIREINFFPELTSLQGINMSPGHRRLFRTFAVAFIALIATRFAMADACTVTGDGGGSCVNVSVTQMYVEPGAPGQNVGNVYVQMNGSTSALTCTLVGGGVVLPFGDANYKVAYSTLLASQLAGRPVDIRIVKDSGNNCTLGYLVLH